MSAAPTWSPTSPLAPGRMLLEASAGTGKTYNLTNWVIRLVAEYAIPIREMVVVTFTRAATAELEDRIRTRLTQVVSVLEGRRPADPNDPVLAALIDGSRAAEARGESWLRRLRDAQESFDECLISTIHGFCQRMLQQNAFEAQTDFDLDLVEDTGNLRAELVDDWLSSELYADDPQQYRFLVEACGFDRATLSEIAVAALRDPDMTLVPGEAELPSAEDWESELDAFRQRWRSEWAEALAQLFEDAQRSGIFKPRQRKYGAAGVSKQVAKLTAWLDEDHHWSEPVPALGFFSPDGWAEQLAPDATDPTHPALDALAELAAFPSRLVGGHRARFVRWLRREFDRRNLARRTQSFADLMRSLARVLDRDRDDPGRIALVQAVRSRYQVALIDEFQDTDAKQWTIFRSLFGGEDQRLYLIGDPKQAIYGFRGANVHVYLKAKRDVGGRVATMVTNYRTDQRLVDAFNHAMNREGLFGEAGIEYEEVGVPERDDAPADRVRHPQPWTDAGSAPLQLRFVDQHIAGVAGDSDEDERVTATSLETLLPARVADDIVSFLESGAELFDHRELDTQRDCFRPVGPGDIAVLTRTGRQARAVQDALGAAGVPSVLQGADSVLASQEARELELWLEALAAPGRDGPSRCAATTRLFGRDAALLAKVDAADPPALVEWETWSARLADWRKRFATEGFLSTLRRAMQEDLVVDADGEARDATTRLLLRPDGERRLTNLWHVAELAHAAEMNNRLSLPGLLAWLKQQRADPSVDAKTAELRLERDDDAVKVLTMHKSKGLQFAFVFAPYLWSSRLPKDDEAVHVVPSAADAAVRICDVRDGALKSGTVERAILEARKDAIRLLYVALTRAKFRCVVYLGHINRLENSPVGPVFHGDVRNVAGEAPDRVARGVARAGKDTPRSALWQDLDELAANSAASLPDGAPSIALTRCEPPEEKSWTGGEREREPLAARDFLRDELDSSWRRYSYTALSQEVESKHVALVEEREGFDADAEQAVVELGGAVEPRAPEHDVPAGAADVPLAEFPAGAHAGTFLHEVFERADFCWARPGSDGDEQKLEGLLAELLVRHGFDVEEWTRPLTEGLIQVLRTPLRAALGETRLCDVASRCRLNELRFDFPIAGGTQFERRRADGEPSARVTSEALVAALSLRLLADVRPPDDEATLRSDYLRGLGRFGDMAGFMTGSIDLVFRHEVEGRPCWFVVDYKSNRLDPRRQRRCPIQHFSREGMRYAMEQHHYYLQYHLYLLALHRYLRSRSRGDYDYERDVGGVYYLFVRGMIGADTPHVDGRGHGCFFDKPPLEVIEALDRLFESPAVLDGGVA